MTIRDIANRLNRLHDQRAAQGKTGCLTCTGKRWGVQHLWIVLTNPFYAGVVEVPSWDIRVRGAHAAIIPSATVARVQTVLAAHRNGPLIQHVYLLQGRVGMHVQGEHVTLYCSTATQRNIRYYYRIVNGRRQYFNANAIHRAVLIALRQRIATLGPDPQAAIAQRMRQALAAAQVQMRKTLEDLRGQRKRLLRLGRIGSFSEAEIAGEMMRLNDTTAQTEQECDRLAVLAEHQDQHVAAWQQTVATFQRWDDLSDEARQALVAEMIMWVELDESGSVKAITWAAVWEQLALA